MSAPSEIDPQKIPLSARDNFDFLDGGGQMGERMRSLDWSKTALGAAQAWSPTLRVMVRFLLANRFPLLLWWGPQYVSIYNDAYRPILGTKDAAALGQPVEKVWSEIWHVLRPLIDTPFNGGPPTWMEDLFLEINRHGFIEETHFTVAYSPVPDEASPRGIGGVLATVHEITEQVIGARRLAILRELGTRATEANTAEEACGIAAQILGRHGHDVPFALLYLLDTEGTEARLAGSAGISAGEAASPLIVDCAKSSHTPPVWPLANVRQTESVELIDRLADRLSHLPPGPWSDPPRTALVVPIRSNQAHQLAGFLVAGVSSRLKLDEPYRSFIDLLAAQVATAVANARAYEEERRRAEALAEIDRAKTTFFSNVSHEFRTPLTLLLGPLQDAAERPAEGLRGEALESATRNALRLLKLVNNLLDFSRIQTDTAIASFVRTDLRATTEDLASVFRAAIERAGLRYTVECDSLPAPTFVDRDMWEKIVLNLLSNAFKYTFEGEIRLELRALDNHAELIVADTGVGIPADALSHLFERFYRVPGAQGRTQEGSGIGLSLVKELVSLHGGTIEVESTPGTGSEFHIRVPCGNSHLPPERLSPETASPSGFITAQAFAAESERWLPDNADHGASIPSVGDKAPFPAPRVPAAPATVLVVDDNADMRDYVTRILQNRFVVLTANDGQAALEMLESGVRPDLVLSDVMMPRLDGAGLLQEIRRGPSTREMPVILLSARAGEEAKIDGLAIGADDYLVKPFSARELIARIESHIRLMRLRRETHERVQTVLNSITDGLLMLDREWRYTHVSHQASKIINMPAERLLGGCVWDIFPYAHGTQFYEGYHRAMDSGQPVHFEEYYPEPLNQWLECHCYPSDEGLSVYFRDITQRKEAEQALRQSQKALEDTDRRKDEFLATLAHELRNPLAPIRTAARILSGKGVTGEKIASCADIIQRQTQSMALLLDDLLDISRINSNKFQLKRQHITVSSVIKSAVETARPIIESRGHALTLKIPDNAWTVDADPMRLAQVITNLLTNAAKYTDSNGRIEVEVLQRGAQVEIAVRDNGIGLTASDVGRVFEMFSQVDRALERAQGGLGIGLALVRGIVELHGGEVFARSEGLGNGSEFVVRVPVAPSKEMTERLAAGASLSIAPGHRILVADDNADARETLRMLLELSAHEVRTAGGGREALSVCANWHPELAILDVGMPEMDGYEVAEHLRREAWGKDIILLALTGWGDEKNVAQAHAAGFDHHFTKPVDLDKLERLIQQALENEGPM